MTRKNAQAMIDTLVEANILRPISVGCWECEVDYIDPTDDLRFVGSDHYGDGVTAWEACSDRAYVVVMP